MNSLTSCSKVSDDRKCPYCKQISVIKNGTTKTKKQQFYCKSCNKRFIDYYSYQAYYPQTDKSIILLLKEGVGIRSIARILKISSTTLLKRICTIAGNVQKPIISFGKTYEMDELCTYIKSKSRKRWIAYAIRKDTRAVVDFSIGSRTNTTLKRVTDTLILSNALKVFTDKLPNYKYLLPSAIHSTIYRGSNYIERKNLTIRTHLKRLTRRTICFSKSEKMLSACLRIYFWG